MAASHHADSRTPTDRPTRQEHAAALLLALVCAVLFLRDGLRPDNALVPHPPEVFDVYMEQARATGTFDPDYAFRGNVGMADKYLQSLCWDRVMQDRFRAGELPRWTRDIGCGAPFVPQMAQPWQPINALLLLLPGVGWYGIWYLVHLVLFGWFAYRFVRRLGVRHRAGLLVVVAATLGMWTQCKLHHNVILTAALGLWPMLSSVHALVHDGVRERDRRRAIAWLGLWSGLSWSTGFVVIALQATYLTLAWAALLAITAPSSERLRRLVPVGIGLGLGALLSLGNMLPILFASAESARSGAFDHALLRALGLEWDHLLTLAWPDLLSWPATVFYPDSASPAGFQTRMPLSQLVLLEAPRHPVDGSAFQSWVETSFAIGLVPLGACLSALACRRHRRYAWFFAGIALVAFGIATATEPFFTLMRALPGIDAGDLRRLLFSVAMPLVVLCGLGADAWLEGRRLWPARAAWLAVAVTSLVALGWLWQHDDDERFVRGYVDLYMADADHPDVTARAAQLAQHPAVRDAADPDAARAELLARLALEACRDGEPAANRDALLATAWRSLLLAALALLLSLRFTGTGFSIAIAATIAELVVGGLGPMQTVPAKHISRAPVVLWPVRDATVPDQPRPRLQRLVLPTGGSDVSALPGNLPGFLGFADANAYNPLPKARYEQFFDAAEPGCARGGTGVGAFRDPATLGHPLLDLFGIRFVVARTDAAAAALANAAAGTLADRTPAETGRFRLLERTTTLPRATFVRDVQLLPDPAQRLAALAERDRDVQNRMVLERTDAPAMAPLAPDEELRASAVVTEHRDERVVVQVRCSHDGYLRLADPYDAGWTATIDGAPAEVLVADHYLRAVHIAAAGEHEVVFRYDGARVVWPLRLTLLGWCAVLALGYCGRRRR